jgi:hypothetical protein
VKGLLNGLQSKIKSTAPQAMFIHCYAHRLNLVLQDAVGEIQEVKIFFATLSGISVFFSKSTKRTNVLNRICSLKIPGNSQMRWNFKPRRVSADLKYSVLGFEPIWFGPTILVRRLRVMSLFWPIR